MFVHQINLFLLPTLEGRILLENFSHRKLTYPMTQVLCEKFHNLRRI